MMRTTLLSLCSILTLCPLAVSGTAGVVDSWRYTLKRPGPQWQASDFDDASWTQGPGGFGTRETPGARIGTVWSTPAIWLRKTFTLETVPARPALLIHHDEDAEVYLNGRRVATLPGYTQDYRLETLPQAHGLRAGRNVLAVYCRQTTGGQFIDAHVVDAEQVPTLPAPAQPVQPFVSDSVTPWGQTVTAANAWTEYPRPQLVRADWQSLNGLWDYAVTAATADVPPAAWAGRILVPFCLESRLGGVQRLLAPEEALWYHRRFSAVRPADRRTRLNFEAVDYRCEVFVNGRSVGTHQGGNTPFSFDITEALRDGDNELVLRVEDATEGWQLHGKQTLHPRGIRYTRVSGIWQTVWLERVAPTHLADLKITTDAARGTIRVRPILAGPADGCTLRVVARAGARPVAEAASHGEAVTLIVPQAKLWSPAAPFLYDLELTLCDADGRVLDTVNSYAGIRTVGKTRDAAGHWRFTLNGRTLFHWGTLDQGWWPDGLLTPPSDAAMRFDVAFLKRAGFNMIRKHIKVEPRRYYYHCDRLGVMLWQDHVSGGEGPAWTRLKPNPVDADWPDAHHRQFMLELERMIGTLENHPSIVVWVPFNERWGQHRTEAVGRWVAERDPTRLVNIASGGNFWPVGDIVDAHQYPQPGFPFDQGEGGRFDAYIKVVGEFGGHGFPVPGHLWDAERRNWGYGGLPRSLEEYRQRYSRSLDTLNELRRRGIAGGVYTQTTDVEGEINGLLTYDRRVAKIPAATLAELHRRLFDGAQRPAPPVTELPAAPPPPDAEALRAGLARHDRALHIKAGWIRDPYIVVGPDDHYYLTGTQPNPGDPRPAVDPYNMGLGQASVVGEYVRVWRSRDLIAWTYLGEPFGLDDTYPVRVQGRHPARRLIWAPEIHWTGARWALVHCPATLASLALSHGPDLAGPWTHPLGARLGRRHDPSLFRDDDGTWTLLWGNTEIAPLSADFSRYTAEPLRIDPAGSRPNPQGGEALRRIGHEGATLRKIGGRYVHFGTAWSTDRMRRGTYNLYYCTAATITGPYGPRRFVGRFLGHGTPFQDRQGRWWCTAFFNANVPPLTRAEARHRDLSDNAYTINPQGVTIVPLDVTTRADGTIRIRAQDPDYAVPGPEEAQSFGW